MKKIISFILLGALFLMCFSGCTNSNDENGDKEINQEESPDTNNKGDDMPVIIEGELDKSSDLVVTLVAYLDQYMTEYNLIGRTFAQKVDDIKNGIQPLHVAFDPSDYYFVCGYYNSSSEYGDIGYRSCNEYTWVGYKNESDVKEYYNDMKWAVLFQINRALTVTDMVSNERQVPDMEHFQIIKPTFENGVNINAPIFFNENFIYLDYPYCELKSFSQSTSTLYYSTSIYYHSLVTIPCIYLEDQFYICNQLYVINKDGTSSPQNWLEDKHIKYEFGEYYDDIVRVMDTEKYSVVTSDGRTYIYGVISFEDFNNIIKG